MNPQNPIADPEFSCLSVAYSRGWKGEGEGWVGIRRRLERATSLTSKENTARGCSGLRV